MSEEPEMESVVLYSPGSGFRWVVTKALYEDLKEHLEKFGWEVVE